MTDVDVVTVLLRSGLARSGWRMVDHHAGHMLVRVDRRWCGPCPQIAAPPVEGGHGRLWWHWTAPASIAGIPIAPANHADRAHRLVLSTLNKLGQAANQTAQVSGP